jgi:hypothetical protein
MIMKSYMFRDMKHLLHVGFLLCSFLNHEDGVDILLRNVGSLTRRYIPQAEVLNFNILQRYFFFFSDFLLKSVLISGIHHACYMFRSSRSSWSNHRNVFYWKAQIMEPLITHIYPSSWRFLNVLSNLSPQRPVLKHPYPGTPSLGSDTKFHLHTKQEIIA